MSMRVRTDYVNPLSLMAHQKGRAGAPVLKQGQKDDSVEQLQTKRQQLQNQMLLLRATGTDTAGASAETQKELETALEEVTAELQAVKTDSAQLLEAPEEEMQGAAEPRMDTYKAGKQHTASYGSYRVGPDAEKGWQILFSPYEES